MDAWAPSDLDIPDFLRLSADERRAAWKRNPPKSLSGRGLRPLGDHGGQKTPSSHRELRSAFHLPKTIEPEGLKLLKAAEREAERKKAERLEVLKALPKKPRRTRRHVKPRKPQSRSGAAKQPSARTRKPAPSSRSPRERSGARQRD